MGLFNFFKKQSDQQVQNQNQNLMDTTPTDSVSDPIPPQPPVVDNPEPTTSPVYTPVPTYQQPGPSIPEAPVDEAPVSPPSETPEAPVNEVPETTVSDTDSGSSSDAPDSSDSSSE
jgi:hypothetical protein